jgi:hypothetical protein
MRKSTLVVIKKGPYIYTKRNEHHAIWIQGNERPSVMLHENHSNRSRDIGEKQLFGLHVKYLYF